MTNEAPLDEGWNDGEKQFLRTKTIVRIEKWSIYIAGVLLFASVYNLLVYFIFTPSIWGILGLASNMITISYLLWWRKVSTVYDNSLNESVFRLPDGFATLRALFVGTIFWKIYGFYSVYTVFTYYLEDKSIFTEFWWIQYIVIKITEVISIVLYVNHLRTTKDLEKVVAQ